MNKFKMLTICIPTRNRADLAINAIKSILKENSKQIKIIVSDNSTDINEIKKLSDYCKDLANNISSLIYIKPPNNFSMTQHWDWMIKYSLVNAPLSSHFTILTDRMYYKKNSLIELIQIIQEKPDTLISYNHDRLNDLKKPYVFEYGSHSNKIIRIDNEKFLNMIASCNIHAACPRMLNSIAPKDVLLKILNRYGNIFSSISPDFNFTFRYLDTFNDFYYYDKTLIFHYGIYRSNGASASRGENTKDHKDFIASLGGRSPFGLAPIPEVETAGNAIIHEYLYAKEENKSKKFLPIEISSYLSFIENEIRYIQNKKIKREVLKLIKNKYAYNFRNINLKNINSLCLYYAKKNLLTLLIVTKLIVFFNIIKALFGLKKTSTIIIKLFLSFDKTVNYVENKPYMRWNTVETDKFGLEKLKP